MDLQEFFDLKMHNDTHTNLTYIRYCLAEVEKQCEILFPYDEIDTFFKEK